MADLSQTTALLAQVKTLIDASRRRMALSINAELTQLYWQIGAFINADLLKNARAEYGKQTVQILSRDLTGEYGSGFTEKHLRRMMQFADVFPDQAIVVSLIRQLSWTHLIALIPIKDPLKREFYAEMCRLDRWSVRTLRDKMDAMLYERSAVSRKPEAAIARDLTALREDDQLSPDLVFTDTYVLDFLLYWSCLESGFSQRPRSGHRFVEIEGSVLRRGAVPEAPSRSLTATRPDDRGVTNYKPGTATRRNQIF